MHYDLGDIDLEQKTLLTIGNPFGTRLSPMSPGRTRWLMARGTEWNCEHLCHWDTLHGVYGSASSIHSPILPNCPFCSPGSEIYAARFGADCRAFR